MAHLTIFETNYNESKHELQPGVQAIVDSVLTHPGIHIYNNAAIGAQIIRLTGQLYKEDVIKLENMHRKPVPRIADEKKAAKAGTPQKDCIICPDNVDIESILNPDLPGLKPVMSRQKRETLEKEQSKNLQSQPAASAQATETAQVNESTANVSVQANTQSDTTEKASEAAKEPENEPVQNESEQRKAIMAELDKHGIEFDRRIRKPQTLLDILEEALKGKE